MEDVTHAEPRGERWLFTSDSLNTIKSMLNDNQMKSLFWMRFGLFIAWTAKDLPLDAAKMLQDERHARLGNFIW